MGRMSIRKMNMTTQKEQNWRICPPLVSNIVFTGSSHVALSEVIYVLKFKVVK